MKKFKFPKDFLWGTATAPTQIDGGDTASDWAEFCQVSGRILDGSTSVTGCDHWNRYKSDFAMMNKMGFGAYRLGADWSRFEPRPGEFDTNALDHFRKMLQEVKRQKMRPLLTLQHFAVPAWWLARGGWTKEENIKDFLRFAEWLVENVGDLVNEYITFNEPVVYAVIAYMDGRWPPGGGGPFGYFDAVKVQRSMVLAHFKLFDAIKEIHSRKKFKNPVVSIAKHLRVMDPRDPDSSWDRGRTQLADEFFNLNFCDSIQSGRLEGALGNKEKMHDGNAWDFVGINYYSRDIVSFDPFAPHRAFTKVEVQPGQELNDLGWEIYAEGLTRVIMRMHDRYGLPIRITENGIADANDSKRANFIRSHVGAMQKAMMEGARVQGYYHWTFMDNFEWAEGYSARFGLVEVDFSNMNRKIRQSASVLTSIMKKGHL